MSRRLTTQEIKERVEGNNPTILFIKELPPRKNGNTVKDMILCYCKTCGQYFDKVKTKWDRGCPICANQRIAVGVNDMSTKAPWMVQFLKDKKDAYEYSDHSNKRIVFKCPICGNEENKLICSVRENGFSCKVCGDKISKPNKFLRAIVSKLPLENVVYEYSSEWTDRKRYDVYFEYKNQKYVIEVDGEQHRCDTGWSTYQKQKENDDYKNYLARKNGVNVIRIIAPTNDYETMIQEFLNCKIGDLIKESGVDWNECIKYAEENSVLKDICKEYMICRTVIGVSKKVNLEKNTVSKYLSIGAKIGWCDYPCKRQKKKKKNYYEKYCKDYQKIENYEKAKKDNFKGWNCHHRLATHNKDGELLDKFISVSELKESNLYYDRPPEELIFLTKKEYGFIYGQRNNLGRKVSEEVKRKQSESHIGIHWYTDGKTEIRSRKCPDGFTVGRLPQGDKQRINNSKNKKGTRWWTNGEIDKLCKECPKGFHPGKTYYRKGVRIGECVDC